MSEGTMTLKESRWMLEHGVAGMTCLTGGRQLTDRQVYEAAGAWHPSKRAG